MPSTRPRILYVTDLAYQARGRRYCDEDIHLTARLREDFDVALCHPLDALALMDAFDAVVVRNSGPVLAYQEAYEAFRAHALRTGARVYNPLTGRADMSGKRYLVDLTTAGFPVIPTVDSAADLHRLPEAERYVVKPRLGADSIGLRIVPGDGLSGLVDGTVLVQPHIDFAYEVSFYFVDHDFRYALYAPRPDRRWQLEPYEPTVEDLEFARRFVDWNGIEHGIQRVDACRAPGGELLLVELEDLNPYLSLDALPEDRRDAFVAAFKTSLRRLLAG
ncbi:hypothetical protein [Streptomyces sp. NPDC057877]|uniref:hypothetical protein n=1 Tax=Streptomyces sp. NPDC057877 TaxID=3346269 RepID=UPI003699BBE3